MVNFGWKYNFLILVTVFIAPILLIGVLKSEIISGIAKPTFTACNKLWLENTRLPSFIKEIRFELKIQGSIIVTFEFFLCNILLAEEIELATAQAGN